MEVSPAVLIPLVVTQDHHVTLPDFTAGTIFRLLMNDSGELVLAVPCSPELKRRLAEALEAGALTMGPHGPDGGDWLTEAEQDVRATRDRLIAALEALAVPPRSTAARAGRVAA